MRKKPGNLNIDRRMQLIFALCGCAALFFYWQSWKDIPHLFYDIPPGFTMSTFIGQVVLEGIKNKREARWWARVLLLFPMSMIPMGRVFFNWDISGHLTDVLAVTLIQTVDERLRTREKIAYWFPLPVILYIRWFLFDAAGHRETFNALIAGFAIFLCYRLILRIFVKNSDRLTLEKESGKFYFVNGVNMDKRTSALEIPIEELERELLARGKQTPEKEQFNFKDKEGIPERDAIMTGVKENYKTALAPNAALADLSTWDLARILIFKARSAMDFTRGAWSEDLMDYYEISDDPISKNAHCIAAICRKDHLSEEKKGFAALKAKNYGKTFNLCDIEPFNDQPVSAGIMGSGFLVKEDIIATAGHFVNEENVTDLRFLFGYHMLDAASPVTRFASENIYRGIEMVSPRLNPGSDKPGWVLVRLDRKVIGQAIARLSGEEIFNDQAVYTLGHPLGLPLKFGAGASVCDVRETSFEANLNIYSGSSGSPVFDLQTHEVIGMVVKNENYDFYWTGKGWMSVQYPDGKTVDCTRISDIIAAVKRL